MKNIALLLCCLGLTACPASRPEKKPAPAVPVRLLIGDNGAMYVTLIIADKTNQALLDTGFSGSLLLENSLVRELDLQPDTGKVEAQTMWGDTSGPLKVFKVPALTLDGTLEFQDHTAWQYGGLGRAVVGLGILTNYNLWIDYQGRDLVFLDRSADLPEEVQSWSRLDFDLRGLIWLKIAEKDLGKARVILDSGVVIPDRFNGYHYHTLSVNSPRVQALLDEADLDAVRDLEKQHPGDVQFSRHNTVYLYTDSLQVAGQDMGPHVFVGVPMHSLFEEGALGIEFFKQRKVLLDFASGHIYVDRLLSTVPESDKGKTAPAGREGR